MKNFKKFLLKKGGKMVKMGKEMGLTPCFHFVQILKFDGNFLGPKLGENRC